MARQIYGASGAAQVVSLTGTPTLAAATVKTARTGGTTVTDILNMAGANIAGVVTPDSRGQIIFRVAMAAMGIAGFIVVSRRGHD